MCWLQKEIDFNPTSSAIEKIKDILNNSWKNKKPIPMMRLLKPL